MKYFNKIIILIIILMAITSCSSAIRFSSNRGNAYAKEKSSLSNNNYSNLNKGISDEISINESNNLDKYKDLRKEIIDEAKKYMGTPYCYGGNSFDCIDCSGFVMQVYEKFGIELPRTASEQYSYSSNNNDTKPQIGDLVFFKKGQAINHVGIYVGNNKFIHASTSSGVMISSLSEECFSNNYAGFHSILN
jgi:murein DD-endopeptidase / murein LD-carboxypeptidase